MRNLLFILSQKRRQQQLISCKSFVWLVYLKCLLIFILSNLILLLIRIHTYFGETIVNTAINVFSKVLKFTDLRWSCGLRINW